MSVKVMPKGARLAAAVAGVLALAACSTAVPTETPGVERVGATVLRYKGPEIEAVIGYRFAGENLGADWLILDLATTAVSAPVEIRRDRIFLRTPAGETIPLATQEEFAQAYAGLRSTLMRAAIASDPLDYFRGRRPCGLQLFTTPGEGLTFPSVTVSDRMACSGRLFFFVPGGVQAGHYVFAIDLPESKVRIPFLLAER